MSELKGQTIPKRDQSKSREMRNDNHLDIDHQTNNGRPKSPRDRAKPVVVSHNDQQGPPLDFSFKNIETIESLKTEKPRKGNKGYKKTKEGKYSCVSLRLNNNYIENISGIHSICLEILEAPEKLTWLDLSFNRLTSIPAEITTLSSLKIIYLHGNHLVDLLAVLRPLKMLDGLYSLTLHGNPVEERENYRYKIIAHLPHLKTLDFHKITLAERKKVESMKKKH
ncbi:leucine-rich repeat-containing protein 51 [Halyomorpha halys]|uniref:leucine-rich repeat-containing protein 51 n=1 Tax=Halyomorpha halys TaxID=286706 RepID=UPI0006D51B68|nr:leucine-rich repeat-containing protein 51-like isoform X1 [Halyomorpha halys]